MAFWNRKKPPREARRRRGGEGREAPREGAEGASLGPARRPEWAERRRRSRPDEKRSRPAAKRPDEKPERPAKRRRAPKRVKRSRPAAKGSRARAARAGGAAGLRGAGKASAAGVRATRERARKAAPTLARPARAVLGVLGRVLAVFFLACALVERVLRFAWRLISKNLVALANRLDRVLTPERVAFGLVAAAAVSLIVSQFVDYRGVEVGQPGYEDVEQIAPAPQRLQETPGEAHAYLLIPVALAAVGIAAVGLRRRRWQLGRLVAIAGLLSIALILAFDLPRGLDEGRAEILFAGANATLTEGFWAELAASVGLVIGGLLLAVNLRQRPVGGRASRGAAAKRRWPTLARKRKVTRPAGSKA